MSDSLNVVTEGSHIVLRKADNLRLFQVHKDRDVWLEKSKFKLDGIIGHPYGTLFEVKDGQMVKLERTVHVDTEATVEGKDNRHLLDLDSNQKLKQEEIEQMKKEGISGDHLIEQLIENSATFQGKTGYAQEKWVRKKKKKHLLQFTVLRPTTRLMCEMHWSKGPSRICNLRIDSLAQILTMGNVHANSTVMVVESCLGLVTGAVLERLGGYGKVVSFYHGDSPVRNNLDNYDFPKEVMDTLYNYPLELVNSLKHPKPQHQHSNNTHTTSVTQSENNVTEEKTETLSAAEEHSSQTGSLETVSEQEPVPEEKDTTQDQSESCSDIQSEVSGIGNKSNKGSKADKWMKKKYKPKKDRAEAKLNRAKEIEAARDIILQKNVDCLIVASKFYPTPIVLALIDYVAPSRQVVVYSQFKEALEDCYAYLREHKGLVNYRLTETWLREYQVLPNRTHPVIQMSGTGGYLLTATTIVKPES